jgi:hypothetical protein
MSKNTLRVILLIAIVLWCLALMAGAAAMGFIGLLFAGEPGSGAEVTANEYIILILPMVTAIALTVGLVMLWVKQYHKAALAVWFLSIVLIAPMAYGYIF